MKQRLVVLGTAVGRVTTACRMSTTMQTSDLEETVRQFVREEVLPQYAHYDDIREYPLEIMRKAHQLGLMNTDIPKELGGMGLSLLSKTKIYEKLGYADTGFGTSLMVNELAQTPLISAGSDYLKDKYLRKMLEEPILAAYCTTEANAGSDVAAGRTTATLKGDHYVLSGSKCWISNCGMAEWFFVLARTDEKARTGKAFTGFIVDRGMEGMIIGKKEKNMGQRSLDTRSLSFEGVRVPAKNVVGNPGEGFRLAMQAFDRTRPLVAALACGLTQRALDEASQYALERETFGKPIAEHQAISFKLADIAINLEAAYLLMRKAAQKVDERHADSPYFSSAAKCFATDAAFKAAAEAVQILGANGANEEYPVEKLMRDAKCLQIYGGASEIQRLNVARRLLKKYKAV